MICLTPRSVSTSQTVNLSASGCLSAFKTLPSVKSCSRSAGFTISSTSRPMSVRTSATSSTVAVVARCSLSQAIVNFIALPPRECRFFRTSERPLLQTVRPRQDAPDDARHASSPASCSMRQTSLQPSVQRRHVKRGEAVMPQPPQIRIKEGPKVRNAVFQHRQTIDSDSECKALPPG